MKNKILIIALKQIKIVLIYYTIFLLIYTFIIYTFIYYYIYFSCLFLFNNFYIFRLAKIFLDIKINLNI